MAFARTAAVAGAGTVSCTGTTTVTGTGTTFATVTGVAAATNSARVGGTITVGGVTKTITAITSTTSLTTDTAFGTFTGQAFTVQTGITQTGTDTLSNGVGAITGFSVTNRGDLFRTFDVQGNDLTINGTVTVSSVTAQLRNDGSCNNTFKVIGSASGGEIIFNGRKAAAANGPFPYAGFDWLGTNGLKIMSLEGTATYPAKFRLIDACVRFGADWLTTYSNQYSIVSTAGAICWFLCAKGTGTSQARLRQDNATASIDFQATKTYMGVWLNMGVPQTSLKGYSPIDTDGPEVNVNMVTVATRIPIENYDTTYVNAAYYAGTQIVLYGGAWVRLKNNLLGTNIIWKSQSPNNRNVLEFSKQIKGTLKDSLGNLLSDGYFYFTPVGANVTGIRAKGGTADITFDLSKKTLLLASGSAETEFVYAWDYANSVVNESTYEYFCSGTTKGAETHPAFLTRYGYDTQPITLSLSGNGTYEASAVATSLPTTDKVIDNAAALTGVSINFTTKTITISGNTTVQKIYDYYQYQRNLPANLGEADESTVVNGVSSYIGWSIVVNSGVTLSSNLSDQITSIYANTITNNGVITCIFSTTIGTSTTWRFEDVALGTSLAIYSSTGVVKYFQGEVTAAADYEYYIEPGITDTYTYIIERYGYIREAGTFAANIGGLQTVNPVYKLDQSLIEASKSVVAAYTSLDTLNKVYDYAAYSRLQNPKFVLVEKDGINLNFGSTKLDVDATATLLWSYDEVNDKVIIKATVLAAGTSMTVVKTTEAITFLNSATATCIYVDDEGSSTNIVFSNL